MRRVVGTYVILALVVAGMAMLALALAKSAKADVRFNVIIVPRGYTPCGPAFYEPPMWGGPVFFNFNPPPMYGGGYEYNPYFQSPRRVNRQYGYGQPQWSSPQGYGRGGGGFGLVYDEAYQRRVRQLEQDQQNRLEQMARERARRDAEAAFHYRGW